MRRLLLLALVPLALACSQRTGTRVSTVTPQGGALISSDGLFSLEIPEGALATEVEVSIVTREDIIAGELSSRVYEVSPLELAAGRTVTVRYRAPREPWVGQRTIATFDEGVTQPAEESERDYDHLDHVASAEYGSLQRRLFGLATIHEGNSWLGRCSSGCTRGVPGCMIDPEPLAADGCAVDGWGGPPNTGLTFVIFRVAMAGEGRGFDVDGRCRAPGDCVDNTFFGLGQLANDQIRQHLLGGETLMLAELAGLDHPGDLVGDPELTVKFYDGRDFDDPFFPANNFSVPAGESRCCEFLIDGASLEGSRPTARAQIRARLEAGTVSTVESAETGMWGSLPVLGLFGVETSSSVYYPKGSLHDAQVSFGLEIDKHYNVTRLVDGLLGGVVLARELAATPNPYCKTLNNLCMREFLDARMIDLLIPTVGLPDVDRDGDGLETFRIGPDGTIVECIDGDGSLVPPVDPARPASCAEHARIGDGYSVAYTFEAVAAKVKGVYERP